MSNVLEVKNISKSFKDYSSEYKRILSWFGFDFKATKEHSILDNISFSMKKGEAVGVIGKNGAGKSTLLKLITGILRPNKGSITINGRISAILELGMGFNPDLSGRQNAYHTSGIMGYTNTEIDQVIDWIEKFADIGEYFDQPVRIYSSGMQARVAFAVATANRPDILIVDEVLSVGDLSFQAKCMMRMDKFLNAGTSLFFVSHSLGQVRQLCDKAIYIADGKLIQFGDVARVCDLYQNSLISLDNKDKQKEKNIKELDSTDTYSVDAKLRLHSIDDEVGTLDLEFTSFKVLDENSKQVKIVNGEEILNFQVSIRANQNVESETAVGLLFCDKTGYPILSCNSNYYDVYVPCMKKGEHIVLNWKIKIPFMTGEYRIDIGMKPDIFDNIFYDRVFCAGELTVVTHNSLVKQNFGGMMYVKADVKII